MADREYWRAVHDLDDRLYKSGHRHWLTKMPGAEESRHAWSGDLERQVMWWSGTRFLGAAVLGSALTVVENAPQPHERHMTSIITRYNYRASHFYGNELKKYTLMPHVVDFNDQAEQQRTASEIRQSAREQRRLGLVHPEDEDYDVLLMYLQKAADGEYREDPHVL